jgi:hypothetical protein
LGMVPGKCNWRECSAVEEVEKPELKEDLEG